MIVIIDQSCPHCVDRQDDPTWVYRHVPDDAIGWQWHHPARFNRTNLPRFPKCRNGCVPSPRIESKATADERIAREAAIPVQIHA